VGGPSRWSSGSTIEDCGEPGGEKKRPGRKAETCVFGARYSLIRCMEKFDRGARRDWKNGGVFFPHYDGLFGGNFVFFKFC